MSRVLDHYPLGGRKLAEHRYVFKNAFDGAMARKRLGRKVGFCIVGFLLLVIGGLCAIIAMRHVISPAVGVVSVFGMIIFGTIYLIVLSQKTKSSIGTFVCELSTSMDGDQKKRHFECRDLRGDSPKTIATGSYLPTDLELRGVLKTTKNELPWVELRLNVPEPAAEGPESIVLLSAPTQAHKLVPTRVITMTLEALVSQGLEMEDICVNVED